MIHSNPKLRFWSGQKVDFQFLDHLNSWGGQVRKLSFEDWGFKLRKLNVILVPEQYLWNFARSCHSEGLALWGFGLGIDSKEGSKG
jgi:hypothetical protein